MKALPASSPMSCMVQMLGWFNAEAVALHAGNAPGSADLGYVIRKKFEGHEAVQTRVFRFVNRLANQ
jgi:hypothetical protein